MAAFSPGLGNPPASVLVYVGLDAVGDGLMKLPFARALRAAFPGARVTWLAGKGHSVYAGSLAPLVAGLIDEVVDEAGIGSRVGELLGPRPLAGRTFDLVIDTQRRVLTTLILRRMRHRHFVSAAADFRLSDLRPPRGWRKPAAMVAQMMALLEVACGRRVVEAAPLARDPAIESLAETLLPAGPRYVGFAPGAGGRHKCWPFDRFLALAAGVAARGLVPVILLGPNEAEWIAPARDALPGACLPLQAAPVVSPMLTIALGRRLAVAVANDSGAGHMLAAAGVPLVSLFGPTPSEKFAPIAPVLRVLRAQDCGGADMAAIPLSLVESSIYDLLGIEKRESASPFAL